MQNTPEIPTEGSPPGEDPPLEIVRPEQEAIDSDSAEAEERPTKHEDPRPSESNISGDERTLRELSAEEEQALKDRLQRRTQEGHEDPYVRGAELGTKYKKLDKIEKAEFKHITSLYLVQKKAEGEDLDINSPLVRALDKYGNYPREDNFKTAQDTLNTLCALKMMRDEDIPRDMAHDIQRLEGKLIDNLQVNEKQGLAKLFSRGMPNSRAAFAEEHWLGEKVDAEELLIKGLNAKTEGIIHEASERDEKPPEPEQTPEQQELIGMMDKVMEDVDIEDPSRLEEITPQYIEQAKEIGVSEEAIQDLEKAAEAYAEEKNSDSLKILLMLLLFIGTSMGEVARRR